MYIKFVLCFAATIDNGINSNITHLIITYTDGCVFIEKKDLFIHIFVKRACSTFGRQNKIKFKI